MLIDSNRQIKVMFVCMGNICRSPTAHAVMQNLINTQNLTQRILVESSGTHAYHIGEKSDPRSRALAREKDIDMEFIRAQKISVHDYDEYDFILAMDEENLALIDYYAPDNHSARIGLFLDFARERGMTDHRVVPDPYYRGDDGFESVFQLVELGCLALLEQLQSDHA